MTNCKNHKFTLENCCAKRTFATIDDCKWKLASNRVVQNYLVVLELSIHEQFE